MSASRRRIASKSGFSCDSASARELVERVREVLPSVRCDLEELVRIESVWATQIGATRFTAARVRWQTCCRRPVLTTCGLSASAVRRR